MNSRGLRGLRVIRQLFFVGAYLPSKPNVHKRFFIFLTNLYMELSVAYLRQSGKIPFAHYPNHSITQVFCDEFKRFEGIEGNQTAMFRDYTYP